MTRPAPSPLLLGFAGILLGYVALASIVGLAPPAVEAILGQDRLLEPGTFAPTPLFAGLQLGIAGSAALVAGFLCRWVAGASRPVWVFAAIILIVSLFTALIAVTVPRDVPQPRTGAELPDEIAARMSAEQPAWLVIATPLTLTAGILVGGRRRRKHTANLATAAR